MLFGLGYFLGCLTVAGIWAVYKNRSVVVPAVEAKVEAGASALGADIKAKV